MLVGFLLRPIVTTLIIGYFRCCEKSIIQAAYSIKYEVHVLLSGSLMCSNEKLSTLGLEGLKRHDFPKQSRDILIGFMAKST